MNDTQGEHRDKMVDAYSVCFIGSQIENTSVFCLIRLVKLLHFDMVEPKGLARSAMTKEPSDAETCLQCFYIRGEQVKHQR